MATLVDNSIVSIITRILCNYDKKKNVLRMLKHWVEAYKACFALISTLVIILLELSSQLCFLSPGTEILKPLLEV